MGLPSGERLPVYDPGVKVPGCEPPPVSPVVLQSN